MDVGFSGVEECHAAFNRGMDYRDGLLPFGGRTIPVAQPHAAQSDGRNLQAFVPKLPSLHVGGLSAVSIGALRLMAQNHM